MADSDEPESFRDKARAVADRIDDALEPDESTGPGLETGSGASSPLSGDARDDEARSSDTPAGGID